MIWLGDHANKAEGYVFFEYSSYVGILLSVSTFKDHLLYHIAHDEY